MGCQLRRKRPRPARNRVANADTTFDSDATLELLGHANARGIIALSLERDATRRDAAQAVTNSQRPEVHGALEAFLVEADTSPRNKKRRTVQTEVSPSSKGDGGERKTAQKVSQSWRPYGSKDQNQLLSPTRMSFCRWPITCSKVLTSIDLSVTITLNVPKLKAKHRSLESTYLVLANTCHGQVGRRPSTVTLALHSLASSGELEASISLPD